MRYGLTMNAWMPSARPSATATITTSSTIEAVSDFDRFTPGLAPACLSVFVRVTRPSAGLERLAAEHRMHNQPRCQPPRRGIAPSGAPATSARSPSQRAAVGHLLARRQGTVSDRHDTQRQHQLPAATASASRRPSRRTKPRCPRSTAWPWNRYGTARIRHGAEISSHIEAAGRDLRGVLRQLVLAERELVHISDREALPGTHDSLAERRVTVRRVTLRRVTV